MTTVGRWTSILRALTLTLALPWLVGAPASAGNSADVDAVLDQARNSAKQDDFLPPDQAFHFSAHADAADRVQLDWVIAQGYYLYRDRIHVASDDAGVQLGAPDFPAGIIKNDEYFGKQVIYHTELLASVPVQHVSGGTLSLKVTYQGCAEAGLCYPPITRNVSVTLPGSGATPTVAPLGTILTTKIAAATYVSEQDRLAADLRSGNLAWVLLEFFGGGLVLAFTPCVLPMVPILSGLIVGNGRQTVTTSRAFLLSLTYVLGMALTYTAAGVICAAAGKQVQAAFQQPWIIGLFAALFVAMALSMFGLFTVQMPSFIQTRLTEISNRQSGGQFGGVAVMGALSSLIVTTCVGPVLVAALVVIGQTGNLVRGGAALFSMSLGMGAPLLVVGASAGRWLPKAGAWMESIKHLFGALMLALAAWMLTRVLPARWALVLWAIPLVIAVPVLWRFVGAALRMPVTRTLTRAGALAAAVYAVLLLVGAARGSTDPLAPWQRGEQAELPFQAIHSVADLDREVAAAAAAHQPVMLDFYADWCTSCKEMQRYTFTDPQVRSELQSVRLLRADVTANNSDDQALLKRFAIFGPPTIAFYDAGGNEQQRYRVVGYMKAPAFATLVRQAMPTG